MIAEHADALRVKIRDGLKRGSEKAREITGVPTRYQFANILDLGFDHPEYREPPTGYGHASPRRRE